VELKIKLHPENIEVVGNHVMLQQVMVNLITNAMQAMEDQTEQKRILVACQEDGDKVTVAVQDNGPGVSSRHRADIFEPFYTTKKSGHGLGLGLTISARIIKDLGGEIFLADSTEGARFEFTLKKMHHS
ncbi:MAG: sensor histidine kinase, partial [Desulforhopalus sp.]